MSTLTLSTQTAAFSRSSARGRLPVSALALLGGALAIGGAAAPWLSLFAGLQPIAGLDGLNGRAAVGLGVASIAAGLLLLATGRSGLRWMLGLLGFGILAISGWSGVNLLTTLAALQADPLLVAQPGPGVAILALGGALVFATMFLPTHNARNAVAAIDASAAQEG